MTNIIKAGALQAENEVQHALLSSYGKLLICTSNVSVVRHLTCYTQTWVVKSMFGQQLFKDYQLASAYYQRLPNLQAGQ